MNNYTLIHKAILSEKAYKLMEKGRYTFLVDNGANKNQVAKAVKAQFAVDVKWVNTSTFAQKKKRIGQTRKFANVGGGKKAIVQLAPGQNIAILSPKKEAKAKKVKASSSEKDIQKVAAEGKEG